jgi:hypothetical protein
MAAAGFADEGLVGERSREALMAAVYDSRGSDSTWLEGIDSFTKRWKGAGSSAIQ